MGEHTEDLVHVQVELATRQALRNALELWAAAPGGFHHKAHGVFCCSTTPPQSFVACMSGTPGLSANE